MTTDEKRNAIEEWCKAQGYGSCTECPHDVFGFCGSYSLKNSPKEIIDKWYDKFFPSRNIENDNVNHPTHYETGKFECIDVMIETQGIEAVKNFCICNAFKYLYRHGRKNGIEDIKKANWYLSKYIELSEGECDEK